MQIIGTTRRKALVVSFDGKCYYCQQPVEALGIRHPRHPTRDHKIPTARNGSREPHNIVLSCIACNQVKGDMTDGEFQHFISTGTLAGSYIEWITGRLRKFAKTNGVTVRANGEPDQQD